MARSQQQTRANPALTPVRSRPEALAAGESSGARVAAAIALASVLTLAAATAVFALVALLVVHSETLEDAEWLVGVAVVPPLAAYLAVRLLSTSDSPAGNWALVAVAPVALLVGCAAFALARATGALPGRVISLPASLLVFLVPPLVLLALRPRALPAAVARVAGRMTPGRAHALAAGSVALAGAMGVAVFLPVASRDPVVLVRALQICALAFAVFVLLHGRTCGRRTHLALAVVVPLALALLAWDVSFQPLPSHQDFYLGPVNDIHHGRYMLVDDYSQYGVAVIYFVAAILAPLPFGYGTFVLALGILSALLAATVFTVVRVATRSLAFAGLGTLIALIASSIATLGRDTQYPSTGFLRFGVPWLLVCALVVAYRNDRPARVPLLCAYALVGVAAVWSVETAFYTFATYAVSMLAVAWTRTDGARLRYALVQLAAGCAAALLAIAILVVATELGRGTAPHVGPYIAFLRLYTASGFGQLPIASWSLGYLMGALYATSLTAIAVILVRSRGSALARPATIVPLTAVSVFGAMSLTYFVGRSHPNNLTNIAPPFVVMLTLWAALAWGAWVRERNRVALAAVALAALFAALLTAQQAPQLAIKVPDSALAAVVGGVTGGRGLVSRVRVLVDLPLISPRTRTVEALVRANVPSGAPLLVAVEPGVATESLIRLGRSDVLPIGTPEQDGLPPRLPALERAAATVPCGTYVVTQQARIDSLQGRQLFASVLAVLHARHSFLPVAASSGYRVFRLGCGPA